MAIVDPFVPPKTGPTRAIGYLNLIFGGFLSLAGIGLLMVFVPFLRENHPFQLDPVFTRDVLLDLRRETLERMQTEEKGAKNEAARIAIAKSRGEFASKPLKIDEELDFKAINEDLPWISRYLWLDLLSAPPLSFLLLISGTGLIALKSWGRRLALLASTLKIVRLLGLAIFLLAVVVPHAGRTFRAFAKSGVIQSLIQYEVGRVNSQGVVSAWITASDFAEILIAICQGSALLMLFFGIIYPVLALVVLTRAGAKAACSATNRPANAG